MSLFTFTLISWTALCTVHFARGFASFRRFLSAFPARMCLYLFHFFFSLFAQSCNRQESWITEHVASELPTAAASCSQGRGKREDGVKRGDNNASCCNNAEAKTVARRGVNFTNTNTTTSPFALPSYLPPSPSPLSSLTPTYPFAATRCSYFI